MQRFTSQTWVPRTAYRRFTVFCRSVASAVVLATCCWWTPPGKSATRPRPLAFTGGHTETTACDRHTENCPWVLLTGQQPGVLAGDGRAHSRLQCAGWFPTLQEEKKEKKQFETGHHEPRRLHTHRWEVADWMVFARRLGDLLFQTAAWLRCGSGALEMTRWHVHECGVDHAEPSTHSITNFRFSLPPSPPSTMLCPGSRPIFVSDVFRPPSPESTL